MQRVDPFAALLDVIDRRSRRFGPDRTGIVGTYDSDSDSVTLDTGQVVPHPVLVNSASPSSGSYPCVWMQGGHDILVFNG